MLSLMQVAAALQGITIDLKASSQGLINLIISVSPPCRLLMNGQWRNLQLLLFSDNNNNNR